MKGPKTKFEVLLACVDLDLEQRLPMVIKQVNEVQCQTLLINQTRNLPGPESTSENLRILNYDEKGISKSRNRALESSSGEILLFCDEDVQLLEGFESLITRAFDKNPEADIITFQSLNQEGKERKKYLDHGYWHNLRTAMRVSSIEIAVRRNSLVSNSIQFDERFGIGSTFPTGSETVFLYLALMNGLRILYHPEPIVSHPDESSGRALYHNDELIKAKGAMFYRIFGPKAYGISLVFAFVKKKETGLSTWRAYRLMVKGVEEFKKLSDGE